VTFVAEQQRVGRYELGRVLGRGRQSTVHLARADDGTPVAVKVSRGGDFASEYRLLRALPHPHLVRPIDCGRAPQGGWLAMEWAQGGALSSLRGTAVPTPHVHRWLAEAAQALAHLHGAGWVHRDVKPANLLLRADGSLALADFGEAVPTGSTAPAAPGTIVGSPSYAAPEQSRGAPAAFAADVYSLGIVLHEWLTGRLPFPGQTPAEQQAQHLVAPVPRLPSALSHWQALLDAMLAKDPAHRLPDGGAVLTRKPK
jgi:serine/threonine protein kinase